MGFSSIYNTVQGEYHEGNFEKESLSNYVSWCGRNLICPTTVTLLFRRRFHKSDLRKSFSNYLAFPFLCNIAFQKTFFESKKQNQDWTTVCRSLEIGVVVLLDGSDGAAVFL